MSTTIKRIAAALSVMAFAALLAWLGGYDFNTRSFWVAYGFGWAALVAIAVAILPSWESSK